MLEPYIDLRVECSRRFEDPSNPGLEVVERVHSTADVSMLESDLVIGSVRLMLAHGIVAPRDAGTLLSLASERTLLPQAQQRHYYQLFNETYSIQAYWVDPSEAPPPDTRRHYWSYKA